MLHKISSKKGSRSDPAPEVHLFLNRERLLKCFKQRGEKRAKAIAKHIEIDLKK
jgi:hypothetical protein